MKTQHPGNQNSVSQWRSSVLHPGKHVQFKKKKPFSLDLGFPEYSEEAACHSDEEQGLSRFGAGGSSPPCPPPLPYAGFEAGGIRRKKGGNLVLTEHRPF